LSAFDLRSSHGSRTFVFCHRKPSEELLCELRKRIVSRAHDYDAIPTTGQFDQHVATRATVWKSKGLPAAPLDFANNIVAADAAVDRTAEINGLRHNENVVIAQSVCKTAY
jgi:hypothetical protein